MSKITFVLKPPPYAEYADYLHLSSLVSFYEHVQARVFKLQGQAFLKFSFQVLIVYFPKAVTRLCRNTNFWFVLMVMFFNAERTISTGNSFRNYCAESKVMARAYLIVENGSSIKNCCVLSLSTI